LKIKRGLTMAKLDASEAKRMVSNTLPQKAFWVNNGPVIRSMTELAAAAKKLTEGQFLHHVNNDKNDFAKWVSEVIGDSVLARKLRQVKTKDGLVKEVASRLKQLQKIIG